MSNSANPGPPGTPPVLEIRSSELTGACTVAIKGAGHLAAAVLGIRGAGSAQRATVLIVPKDADRTGSQPGVDLAPAGRVSFLGAIDLGGAPGPVALQERACANGQDSVDLTSLKRPALLLKLHYESAQTQDTLVVLSLENPPRVAWKEVLASLAANGSGYETAEMRSEPGDEGALSFVLLQHALPARGEADYMPGPPNVLRFRAVDGVYRRVAP